jgi:periplasmic copper chaperone A
MTRKFGAVAMLVATMLALWTGWASAHVTVSPSSIPQGTDDAVLTFRVPNESTSASVTALRVQFPLEHPIVLVNPEAGSGWNVSVRTARLPRPITTDDGTFTSTTSEIDWSGGTIPVGQFGQFNVLAQGIPSGTSELVFKAIQTYSDGTVVSWIQVPNRTVPDPPHPAPTITLTSGKGTAADSTPQVTSNPATSNTATVGTSSGSNALAVGALVVSGFAVLLALLAVWLGRPRWGRRSAEDGAVQGG